MFLRIFVPFCKSEKTLFWTNLYKQEIPQTHTCIFRCVRAAAGAICFSCRIAGRFDFSTNHLIQKEVYDILWFFRNFIKIR